MKFYSILLCLTAFCLRPRAVNSFGELALIRSRREDNSYAFTCVAEDHRPALVLNYDIRNFILKGAKRTTQVSPKCAISSLGGNGNCNVPWQDSSDWEEVDSSEYPMGPVFDSRWEEFQEFVLKKDENFKYVGNVSQSDTVVFSAREFSGLRVILCAKIISIGNSCFEITIPARSRNASISRLCLNEGNTTDEPSADGCYEEAVHTQNRELTIDAYEWRTFTLKWDKDTKTIKIYRDAGNPFERKFDEWIDIHHLFVQSLNAGLVRFHFYKYLLTQKNNVRLSFKPFFYTEVDLCLELHVGLCFECNLEVSIVDRYGHTRKIIGSVSGNATQAHGILPTWRTVSFTSNLKQVYPSDYTSYYSLEIHTKNENDTRGWWAIDGFRQCSPVGIVKTRTVTFPTQSIATSPSLLIDGCQQLSYSPNAIVRANASFTDTTLSNLQQCDSGRVGPSCAFQCANSCTGTTICDKSGCTCAPGFTGSDCNEECSYGYYGYNCRKTCGSCKFGTCDKKTGSCSSGCKNHYLPPKCEKMLEAPSACNVTATTAVLRYPTLDVEDMVIYFLRKTKVTNWTTILESPIYPHITSEYTIQIKDLLPSTQYWIRAVAVVITQNRVVAMSPKSNFTTQCRDPGDQKAPAVIPNANGVSASLGFAREEKLDVVRNGTDLILKLPPITNRTGHIVITVVVKGTPNCANSPISDEIKKLVNMTNSEVRAGTFKLSALEREPNYWKITAYLSRDSTGNCFLHPEETYVIMVVVVDEVNKATAVIASPPFTVMKFSSLPLSGQRESNFIWLVIPAILLTSFLLLFVWREKLFDAVSCVCPPNFISYPQTFMDLVKSSTTRTSQQLTPLPTSAEVEMSGIVNTPETIVWNHYSHSVNIEDFEDYVKASIANGLLRSQFSMIRKDMNKPREYGLLPKNKLKNRYINILPYDDTRVVLTKTRDDPYSDYINANYVQGFRKEKAYIAAQGPKPQTIVDFWRMIWQEKAQIVCMLANVIEGQKVKCEQYWPEIGDSKTYGDIVVVTENHHVFVDYTIRTLHVSCQNKSRKIEHLHYTGWPDHNVPIHTNSVISYLKKLQAISIDTGPIIVHCSAGVGRSGTIILCDICLRRANAKGTVDVLTAFRKLRECRLNMVDNELQYLFAHLVLVEYLLSPSTNLPCNKALPLGIEELKNKLPEHIERLRNIAWQDHALHSKLPPRVPLPEQLAKNRFPELAPDWSDLVYLKRYPTHDSSSDYISTVIVDGLKTKKQFVASQLPLPTTLSDFWRLIAEQRIELVIVLQRPDPDDPTCCDIISDGELFNPVPFITVERKTSADPEKSTKIEEMLLTEVLGVKERTQKITVLTCQGWGLGKDGKPPPPEELIELWKCSKNVHQEAEPTLVLCHDGIAGCGLYLALSFLLERMAVEQECDVIFAVRTIRRCRPEFVQSQDQFEYLYDAAVKYAESFETNSNLT